MENVDAIARDLGRRFIARADVLAVQHPDGSYHPERRPFTGEDLRRHVGGKLSLGHYLVNQKGMSKLCAFDLDLEKTGVSPLDGSEIKPRDVWLGEDSELKEALRRELLALGVGLACRMRSVSNFPVALAYSGGKGVHVYGLHGMLAASKSREIAISLLEQCGIYAPVRGNNFWKHLTAFPNISVEIFPKQETVQEGDGLGNLMRLPLGRNARTGQPAFFLTPGEWSPCDPLQALQTGNITPEWLKESAR